MQYSGRLANQPSIFLNQDFRSASPFHVTLSVSEGSLPLKSEILTALACSASVASLRMTSESPVNIMSTRKPPRPISPLYVRYLTSDEKKSLRAVPVNDLTSEINLVRVVSAHFMEFQQSAPKDMGSRLQSLRTSFVLGEQFAKLIRAHNTEHDPLAELQDVIEQALEEVRKEWGID